MKISLRDYWRPIFGLFAHQPMVLAWCYLTQTAYFSNLGWFSILSCLYFIPVYAWYESKCDELDKERKSAGWPY
jgi:hypothetical protein